MIEAALDATLCDDEQGWHVGDAEARRQVGPLVDIDAADDEGAMVLPSLQHLGDKALNAPRSAVELGVEEDEPRARVRSLSDRNRARIRPDGGGTARG